MLLSGLFESNTYFPYINRHDASPHRTSSHHRPSARDNPSHRRRKGRGSSGIPLEGVRLGTDFRAAVSRFSSPVPQSLLKALGNRTDPSIGKVHVSLRVTPSISLHQGESSIISLDQKRRQATILEHKPSPTHDRVGVSAPKMFAFDQVYSHQDDQSTVVSRVLPDILQAVLGGTDGCVMCFGGSAMGKTQTMVGSHFPGGELGVIPTAIAWLYQAITNLKANKATRFSVRVSAVVVDAPGREIVDVLGDYAQDNETSPGALLRQGSTGLLSSVSELRAPFPETAARYLDLALSTRSALATGSGSNRSGAGPTTLLFTLHVYQYTFDKAEKGRVVGGRSRLHLIDLGDMSGHHAESLSLSGLTSVLLAIFNGHKYLPHKFNRLTQLLQEILGSVTCHAALIVHVSPSSRHAQHTLATLQLASRVHRLRRKKIRGLGGSGSGGSSEGSHRRRSSGGDSSAGSSSIDFSSSEQSADTVIYIGGGGPGDSSDGEHPPIFFPHHIRRHRSVELPRLRSFEQLRPHTASPNPVVPRRPVSVSPTPTSRSVPSAVGKGSKPKPPPRHNSSRSLSSSTGTAFVSSPLQTGFFRHQPGVSHVIYPSANSPREPLPGGASPFGNSLLNSQESVKGNRPGLEIDKQAAYQFYREPNTLVPIFQSHGEAQPHKRNKSSSELQNGASRHSSKESVDPLPPSDEHWIDGPRMSKSRVNAAKNKLCQSETWVDGPHPAQTAPQEKGGNSMPPPPQGSYGFMDDHKKIMIERWVENQTAQVVVPPTPQKRTPSEDETPAVTAASSSEVVRSSNHHNSSNLSSLPNPGGEELNLESDVDTLSEDHSGAMPPPEGKQPNLIEELERKNLIPVVDNISLDETSERASASTENNVTKEEANVGAEDPSGDEVCSQCEALAEEEWHSLISCQEECQRQGHNGLATVVEEPELESAFGGDGGEDPTDSVSLLNNPQTDCEDTDGPDTMDLKRNPLANRSGAKSGRLASEIKMADCSVQVCEEDISRTLSTTPCPSDVTLPLSDDHPLRVLSEENLTCASTFTDSCSQMGETGDEDENEDDPSRPLSLLEVSEYGRICHDLSFALRKEAGNKELQELVNIHRFFSAFAKSQQQEGSSTSTPLHQSFQSPLNGPASRIPHRQPVPVEIPVIPRNWVESKTSPCTEPPATPYSAARSPQRDRSPCRYSIDKSTGTDDAISSPYGHSTETLREVPMYECQSCSMAPPDASNERLTPLALTTLNKHDDDEELLTTVLTKQDNDSDCPSSVSEDSEYMMQHSKLSKFLCVGIGRSSRKTSSKNLQQKSTSILKGGEGRKPFFRIRDSKSKPMKSKEGGKSPDHSSKNPMLSPSRFLSFRNEDEVADEDGERSYPHTASEAETPKGSSDPQRGLKCHCVSATSPQEKFLSRLEFCPPTSSGSSSGKEWGGPSPLPILSSPQACPPDVHPSGGATKGAAHPMTTSGSLGTTQSLGESSGYESIPRDSECSSFSSSQESEMDEEHRKFLAQGHPQRTTGIVPSPVTPSSSESPEGGKMETKVQNSFLRHLTKKNSSKSEAKVVTSTTWKYRCW